MNDDKLELKSHLHLLDRYMRYAGVANTLVTRYLPSSSLSSRSLSRATLEMRIWRGAKRTMSAPRLLLGNFQVPLKMDAPLPVALLREIIIMHLGRSSSLSTGLRMLVNIGLFFPDAGRGYNMVFSTRFSHFWWVGFEVEVAIEAVVADVFLESIVIDISLDSKLAVVVEYSIIPDLG